MHKVTVASIRASSWMYNHNISILSGKRILLGVTGSIAAYKATDLASKLTQAGAQVDVVLTNAAEKFITRFTFQSVTGRRAYTDNDLWENEAHVLHVGLGHNADLFIIAPCTANTLAKLAHGQSDSLLTVTALVATCPLVIAPAMDGGIYAHIATQENLETLKKRGAYIIEPVEGHLASGLTGKARLPETHELIAHIRLVLGDQRLSIKGVIGEQIRGAFGRMPFSSLVRTLADNADLRRILCADGADTGDTPAPIN